MQMKLDAVSWIAPFTGSSASFTVTALGNSTLGTG